MLTQTNPKMIVLGASGFIGEEVVRAAVQEGWEVHAVVRRREAAERVERLGARAVLGEASQPEDWVSAARGAQVLIDLVQPALPGRITLGAILELSAKRQQITRASIAALEAIPEELRPRWLSVSGVDDLEPDSQGEIDERSGLRRVPVGFSHIGLPVRALLERSSLEVVHAYLGTVYGPGKLFESKIVPGVASGKFPVLGRGSNRMPLVEVVDAARALVHLASHGRSGAQYVIADGASTTQRELLDAIADGLGVRRPRSVPVWIAKLLVGKIAVETFTRDLRVNPEALLATGFHFRTPSAREGVGPMLRALAHAPVRGAALTEVRS